jgi:phosphatidylserine decarboxylase
MNRRWLYTYRLGAIEGKLYDEEGETVKPHIEAFIKTYDLSLTELLEQDLNKYPVSLTPLSLSLNIDQDWTSHPVQTFNAFFSRKLQPSARPIAKQDDQSVLVSPADCRMTVFDSIDLAKKFW